jgi:hypothetical protein
MEMMMEYSKIGMEGERTSKGRPTQVRVLNNIKFESTSDSRTYFTKTDALVTYRVRFGRSIYGWNQNFIELLMAPVLPQNSF